MDTHALLERLAKLPRAQRLALTGLVYALVAVLFWVMLYSPAVEEVDRLGAQQTELEVKRAKVRARAENREKFEAELQELTAALKKALRELPNDREIPELLKRISSVARKVGLEIKKFQPLPEVVREYYAEVPVALEVAGSYHEVAMFFDRLSKLGRIVYVKNVEIKNPEEQGGKVFLDVVGTSVTFRFLSEDEITKAADGQRGKRGKRGRGRK